MTENIEDVFNLKKETNPSHSGAADFFTFRTMITPIIIQILFWIGVAICIIVGIIMIVQGFDSYRGGQVLVLIGFGYILLGPLFVRLYCEFLILFFRMNETLTEIKNKIK